MNRKWEGLGQIQWPLVRARAESDPRLWEEPKGPIQAQGHAGTSTHQTLETKHKIHVPGVRQDWNQKAGDRDQRFQLGNGVRVKTEWE